jgi:hypothetical protein
MISSLNNNIEYVLVLGAGASVDYGLPTWRNLSLLVKEKIGKDTEKRYQYKKEILDWIDKVGEKKKYKTIDECIKEESASKEYHSNGHEIENELFLVMKDIFNEIYKEQDNGWIRALNEKILLNKGNGLEHKIAFINYNYDNVLDKNFLIYTYLPQKHQLFNYRERLEALSKSVVKVLHPHGTFSSTSEHSPRLYKVINTMKSGNEKYLNVVSCFESEGHSIGKDYGSLKLYILGLGGGLQINLNNMAFRNLVSEIHVTIKNTDEKDKIINFLSKRYNVPTTEINVYTTCKELIEKCFI